MPQSKKCWQRWEIFRLAGPKKNFFLQMMITEKFFGFLFEGVDTDLSAISEAVDRFEICQKISNGDFVLEKYLLQDDINEIFDVKDIDPYFYNFNVSDLLENLMIKETI